MYLLAGPDRMRSFRKIILFLILGTFLTLPGCVFGDKTGTTAAQFLKIGVGARASALANAYTGVSGDVVTMFYNPAGLAFTKKAEIAAMHNEHFQDINFEFVGLSMPMSSRHTIGGGIQLLKTTDTERSENFGIILSEFDIEDFAFTLGYSYLMTKRVSMGVNLKYIRQVLFQHSASTLAADVGFLFKSPWEGLDFGVSVQHLGGKIRFIQESDPLPTSIRAGFSYRTSSERVLFTGDVIKYRNEDPDAAVGFEYDFRKLFRLRAGYRFTSDLDSSDKVTLGLGIKYQDFQIDYAFVPFGDLGNTHRISGNLRFGKGERDYTIEVPEESYVQKEPPPSKIEVRSPTKVALMKLQPKDELYRSDLVEDEIEETIRLLLEEAGFVILSPDDIRLKIASSPESFDLENASRILGTGYVLFGLYESLGDKVELDLNAIDDKGNIRTISVISAPGDIIEHLRQHLGGLF